VTTTLQQEIAVEQRHLDRVYARLAELRRTAQRAERDGYRLARVGNYGALVERDAMVFHAARRRAALDAEHEGLVFGRLDRRGGAVQYVGRLGIREADTTPLVIDWRAPAAADFYQATAADPRGVVRRRMIRSSGETVIGLDDDLLDPTAELTAVGDGALLASLTRATGRGMRDIVATIQREQDEAIRSPAGGVTIVEGGPGTGKTAVALHRVAYLLYRDRARFAGGGVLVVGPSAVFVNYIAAVLPSLGEQSATLRALGDVVEGVQATGVDPAGLAAVKGSLRMLTVLRRVVQQQAPGAPTELRLAWHRTLLRVDATTLERIRRRALSRHKRRNEVRRAAFDGIFDALWDEVTGQVPSYDKPRPEFEDEISDRPDFRNFLRAWWPLLRPTQVLSWLADPARLRRLGDGVLSPVEVTALAASFAKLGSGGRTVADAALLDELDALLGQPPRPRRRPRDPYQVAPGVREVTTFADRQAAARAAGRERPADYRDFAHVVVDEAQDVSPMQWRMLGRRGRHASWTVVGDPAQSAWTGDAAELARARDGALRGRRALRYLLTTNYRNSVEIFELAASVIRRIDPDAQLPTAVRTTGIPPVDRVVDDLAPAVRAAAAELIAEVEGTVGVITPLARRDEVAVWIDPDDDRLQVVTSLEAKGMEYDGVVLVEPSEVTAEAGLRTLYVALSRATQRLVTVGTTPWRD
jgi:DNA helicase IV